MDNEDDARLIENILCEVKSQGIFDQFRRQCMADVDIKPAYQNLRQRVESSVSKFLKDQEWKADLNKNQLREKLRKYITDSGFLETGVERIVDQVVNPKINSIFLPKIEDIFYKYIGVDKPKMVENKMIDNGSGGLDVPLDIDVKSTFLPNDLEAVSPDSDKSGQKSLNDSRENLNTSNNSIKIDLNDSSEKVEDFESPAFELIEGRLSSGALSKCDDDDSKLSGISGLTSQDSIESCDDNPANGCEASGLLPTIEPFSTVQQLVLNESHNQDSVLSQVSSGSRLSIVTNESHKSRVDLCEEAQMPKFNENSTESNGNVKNERSDFVFDIKKDQIKFEGTDRRPSMTDIKIEYKPIIADEEKPLEISTTESTMSVSIKTESSSSIVAPITAQTGNLSIKEEPKIDIKMEIEQSYEPPAIAMYSIHNIIPDLPNMTPPLPTEPSPIIMPPPPPSPPPPSPPPPHSPPPSPPPLPADELKNSSEIKVAHEDTKEMKIINDEMEVFTSESEPLAETSKASDEIDIGRDELKPIAPDAIIESMSTDNDDDERLKTSTKLGGPSLNDADREKYNRDHKSHKRDKNRERDRERDRDRDRHSSLSNSRDRYKDKDKDRKHSSSTHRHSSSSHSSSKNNRNEKDENKYKSSSENKRDDSKSRSDGHRTASNSSSTGSKHGGTQSSNRESGGQNHSRTSSSGSNHHHDGKQRNKSEARHSRDQDKLKREDSSSSLSKTKLSRSSSGRSDDKSRKRTEDADKLSAKKSSSGSSKTSQHEDDHSVFRDKHIERRRSTDRDSNDGHSTGLSSRNPPSATTEANAKGRSEGNTSNSTSSSSKGSTSSSPTSASASAAVTELRNSKNSTLCEQVVVTPTPVTSDIKAMLKESLSVVTPITDDNEDDFVLPTLPVVVDQILTGSDISLELLMNQNMNGPIDPVISTIQQSLTNSGVKMRKPKIASNMHEARKLMKVRKQMERQQKKQIEKALVIAKQYINKNSSVGIGFGIDKQGVELQFSCVNLNDGGGAAPRISSPIKSRASIKVDTKMLSEESTSSGFCHSNENVFVKPTLKSCSPQTIDLPQLIALPPPIPPKVDVEKSPKSPRSSPKLSKNRSEGSSPKRSLEKDKCPSANRSKSSPSNTKQKKRSSTSDSKEDFLGFPIVSPKYDLNMSFIKFSEQFDLECCQLQPKVGIYNETAYLYNVEDSFRHFLQPVVPNLIEIRDTEWTTIAQQVSERKIEPARRWSKMIETIESDEAAAKLKQIDRINSPKQISAPSSPPVAGSTLQSFRKNGVAIKKSFEMQLQEASIIPKNGKTNRSGPAIVQKRKLSDLKDKSAAQLISKDDIDIGSNSNGGGGGGGDGSDDGYNNNQVKRFKHSTSGDDLTDCSIAGNSNDKSSPTPSDKSVGSKENKFTNKVKNSAVNANDQLCEVAPPVINKKEQLLMSSVKKPIQNFKDTQRYTSEDLYKPRPILIGSRSRRRPIDN